MGSANTRCWFKIDYEGQNSSYWQCFICIQLHSCLNKREATFIKLWRCNIMVLRNFEKRVLTVKTIPLSFLMVWTAEALLLMDLTERSWSDWSSTNKARRLKHMIDLPASAPAMPYAAVTSVLIISLIKDLKGEIKTVALLLQLLVPFPRWIREFCLEQFHKSIPHANQFFENQPGTALCESLPVIAFTTDASTDYHWLNYENQTWALKYLHCKTSHLNLIGSSHLLFLI